MTLDEVLKDLQNILNKCDFVRKINLETNLSNIKIERTWQEEKESREKSG